ncbi:transporter substrate-binding domain-containing protein [Luteimonas viscosa]|uniref:Transporter substrate-binding domain-containing protein n=1 Tax=Luteimonas viscosa TaxID=1132694 RepID=A0A5D4XN39_9GAMM|nr:transporter substrate-binding domain-containing protein [Luteimonas viscosa]TYT25534.1 transporter substrate-binding domain-containing protein [Luteimonas viscosa]
MAGFTPLFAPALATLFALSACDRYPRDADDLTAQAADAGMRVGASHDPPYVQVSADGGVTGVEAELVRRFADAHGYRVTWVPGGHDALMRDLERTRLHAVIGGHHRKSPWKPKVGWSRPLHQRATEDAPLPERQIALPPGQSQWHLAFDRHLVRHEGAQ